MQIRCLIFSHKFNRITTELPFDVIKVDNENDYNIHFNTL